MPVAHYENFPVASILLPKRLRRPIEAIYHFARSADDLADEGDASNTDRLQALDGYRAELNRIECGQHPVDEQFSELAEVIGQWKIPLQPLRDLLDAFAQDVVKKRYADFPELLDYCRRSANPVGRLLLHLGNCVSKENLRRSDAICTALQLTNFWQDIALDWQKDRVYLPQSDLARFGLDDQRIATQKWGADWAALMDFQTDRARALMLQGAPLVHALPGRLGWEIRLTVQGGLRILEQTRRVRGDVFRHRPQLRAFDWLRMSGRALFM